MGIKGLVLDAISNKLLLRRDGGQSPLSFPNMDGVSTPQSNLLLNGDMALWQRGTAGGTVTTAQAFKADRFLCRATGSGASFLHQRSTLVPNSQFKFSARMLENGDSSVNGMVIAQRIEAATIRPYIGTVQNFSLWIRNDSVSVGWLLSIVLPTGEDTWNADVALDTTFVSKSFAAGLFPTSGSVWTRIDMSFVVPPAAANGLGVRLESPTAYTGTPDVYTTGWMLTQGKNPLPNFVRHGATFQQELAACRRFYEKSYDVDTTPSGTSSISAHVLGPIGGITSGNNIGGVIFQTPKRATPTVSIIAPVSGTAGSVRHNSSDVVATVASIGANGFHLVNGSGGTIAASSNSATVQYVAEIELV